MSKFKVNDLVNLKDSRGLNNRLEGTVTQVLENWASNKEPMYVVQFDNFNDTYSDDELELVETAPKVRVGGVIEFDQIRKGDRVRCVREFLDGFVITKEGIAERLVERGGGNQAWVMGTASHSVATTDKGVAVQQHHILVEREEPKEWIVMVKRGENMYDTASGADRPMTKEAAEAFADRYNSQPGHTCTFWAMKVPGAK